MSLRNDVTVAQKRGPSHLLGRLVASVFSTEELASSCGQGIITTKSSKGNNNDKKQPLDAAKISACKGRLVILVHFLYSRTSHKDLRATIKSIGLQGVSVGYSIESSPSFLISHSPRNS